jgi:hypothetical protein
MLHTLYIPRVNRTHMGHGDYMKKVFEHQGFAMVNSVEFFEHEIPNAAFGFAIVKILFWIPGIVSKNFQQRLKDASKETRIVFSDPSYWIVLPYTEKQKQPIVKIPPPPISSSSRTSVENADCICGCGGGEIDCSSQPLYNSFKDKVWGKPDFSKEDIWAPIDMLTPIGTSEAEREKHCQRVSYILSERQRLGSCRNSWSAMNSIEDNFRFCDTPFGFDFDTY